MVPACSNPLHLCYSLRNTSSSPLVLKRDNGKSSRNVAFSGKIRYGGFLNWGYRVPLNHHFNGSFHYKPTSYWGSYSRFSIHFVRILPVPTWTNSSRTAGDSGMGRFALLRIDFRVKINSPKSLGTKKSMGKAMGKPWKNQPKMELSLGRNATADKRYQAIHQALPTACLEMEYIGWNMPMKWPLSKENNDNHGMCTPFSDGPVCIHSEMHTICTRPKPSLRHLGVWIGTQMVCWVCCVHVGHVGYLWLRSSTSTSSCLGDSSPILLGLISLLPFDWLKKCLLIIILGNPRVQYNLLVHGMS